MNEIQNHSNPKRRESQVKEKLYNELRRTGRISELDDNINSESLREDGINGRNGTERDRMKRKEEREWFLDLAGWPLKFVKVR